jgi:hypothetical protein
LIVSGPLFFVVGVVLDNFVESVAAALMVVCTVWIAISARQAAGSAPAAVGVGASDLSQTAKRTHPAVGK